MKKILILIPIFSLTGCFSNPKITEIKADLEQLNETDKTMANLSTEAKTNKSLKNAFKVFEQLDKETCKTIGLDGAGFYIGARLSISRFHVVFGKECRYDVSCPLILLEEETDEQKLLLEYKDKKFNMIKKYFLEDLSAKEKVMIKECMSQHRGWWWAKDGEECGKFWSEYAEDSSKCLFNYQSYLPSDIKISSYDNFIKLYNAYKESLLECDNKIIKNGNFVCDKQTDGSEKCYEQEHKLTDVEKQQCYDEVEKKLSALAQSGDL